MRLAWLFLRSLRGRRYGNIIAGGVAASVHKKRYATWLELALCLRCRSRFVRRVSRPMARRLSAATVPRGARRGALIGCRCEPTPSVLGCSPAAVETWVDIGQGVAGSLRLGSNRCRSAWASPVQPLHCRCEARVGRGVGALLGIRRRALRAHCGGRLLAVVTFDVVARGGFAQPAFGGFQQPAFGGFQQPAFGGFGLNQGFGGFGGLNQGFGGYAIARQRPHCASELQGGGGVAALLCSPSLPALMAPSA